MAQEHQSLQLIDTVYTESTGWRRNQDLITALPYVDLITDEEKLTVDALIEEEMRSSTKRPSDYLKELTSLPISKIDDTDVRSVISIELERAAQGEPMSFIDTERYNLNPPSSSRGGDNALAAWRAAVDNAQAQLEHQKNRLINLELIQKYGSDAWRASNESLASHVAAVQSEAAATTQAIENLNRERKLQQIAAGRELKALEHQYLHLIKKNSEIEAACRAIEAEAT